MNFGRLKLVGIASLCALLTGCGTLGPRWVNLTPQLMPTNPSGIYTLSLMLDGEAASRQIRGTHAVIGGETYSMQQVPGKPNIYTFDYSVPSGSNRARYYFELLDSRGEVVTKSEIFDLRLTNRYVVELESSRAKPGASVAVLGKGFRDTDRIQFGGRSLETRFLSDNQLSFIVPAVAAGAEYPVAVETSGGIIPIARFRVDFSELRAMPSRLRLNVGETVTVVFTIDQDAPPEGMPLQMEISDAALLDFDPVSIAASERSMHVQFTGLNEGSGSLTVTAPAHNGVTLPISVDAAEQD